MALIDGLVGALNLADAAASTVVVAQKGSNGTYAGTNPNTEDHDATGPSSLIDWSLTFNGSDNHVTTNFGAALRNGTTNEMSWAVWFKINASGRNDLVVWKTADAADGISLEVNGSDKLEFFVTINSGGTLVLLEGTTTISTGTWYHALVTYNGDGDDVWRLYLNGTEEDNQTTAITLTDMSTDELWIGANHNNFVHLNSFDLDGNLSQFLAWNRDLSGAEATSLYNGGLGRPFRQNASLVGGLYDAISGPINAGK